MELAGALEQLRAEMDDLSRRLERLEGRTPKATGTAAVQAQPAAAPVAAEPAEITEDELIAISAAIGAFLGVRAHIRQIRLVSTNAWAQQGRVSIQASHRLQG
jgi:methylmalonyl-CoA carboxyltransferase large subunit